jgi:hypothetical protein
MEKVQKAFQINDDSMPGCSTAHCMALHLA